MLLMFILKKLVMMLIGSVIMVMSVSVNSVWLFCLLRCELIFFCSSLICLLSFVRLVSISENFLVDLCSF